MACVIDCRASAADDVDDPNAEPVDALTMGRMMALVAQQGGDLDVALEQVGHTTSCFTSFWVLYCHSSCWVFELWACLLNHDNIGCPCMYLACMAWG